MKLKNLFAIFFILFTLSCTPYKNVPYFLDLKKDTLIKEKINNFSSLTIQSGDILAIHVTSLNHEADAVFNYNLEHSYSTQNPTATSSSAPDITVGQNAVVGYLVDHQGNIHLPMAGLVKVSGFRISEITSDIESRLSEFLGSPNVEIRIQNFKISVLGDVKNPGYFNPQDEHISVIQALALAGDLNTTGIRKNILLIREIDSTREYIPLNLNSKNLFTSPYYYLKNNDIIYVQPNRDKVSSSDSAFQKASLIISAFSILAIFITRYK